MHAPVRGVPPAHSVAERWLLALGIDPLLVEAAVGDLTEEYSGVRTRRGVLVATVWLVQEILRSCPPVLWHLLRRGTPAARARIAAVAAIIALTLTITVVALLSRSGPPERLIADVAAGSDAVIVNSIHPVQLEMLALDHRGHRVSTGGIQYRWKAGVPAELFRTGVLRCTHDGDLVVRASLGAIASDVTVSCRRVAWIRASSWIDLVAGDHSRSLQYAAMGVDGRPVTELRGQASIADSSIATLSGTTIRPRAVGRTHVNLLVGDRQAELLVTVHERVKRLDALRKDQPYVAVPISLARGDTIRLTLPHDAFWLAYLPRHEGDAPPSITLDGLVSCSAGDAMHQYLTPVDEPRMYCMVHSPSAVVTIAHGLRGAAVVDGSLLFERVDQWRVPQR